MTDDDALIAKAAQAVADEFYRMQGGDPTWPEAPQANEGDYAIAAAVIAAVRDQITAEALREVGIAIENLRQSNPINGDGSNYTLDRLLQETNRADRLDPKETP